MHAKFGSFLAGILTTLVLLFLAGLIVVNTGVYDVGADEPHAPLVRQVLRSGSVHAVRTQAESVTVPANVEIDDPVYAAKAAGHYQQMCEMCHGAPGVAPAEWVALSPSPPRLADAKEWNADWDPEEIFWIIKHGLKDTGMSAYGGHEEDAELWQLAAFVHRLPRLSSGEYATFVERFPGPDADDDHHQHAQEQPPEEKHVADSAG